MIALVIPECTTKDRTVSGVIALKDIGLESMGPMFVYTCSHSTIKLSESNRRDELW